MAVFRVERIKDYTVMSNHHLRNKNLSLKAKGLLSQMLSLPDDWDYTLKGLAAINKESVDAIRTAIWELEDAGYVVRTRVRDERGCLRGCEAESSPRPARRFPASQGRSPADCGKAGPVRCCRGLLSVRPLPRIRLDQYFVSLYFVFLYLIVWDFPVQQNPMQGVPA